ncbi:enoyl-CoA hydratase-related protein [Roseovarius pelagicus]|uniref:Enoyl-CoA hydratase-related protein n=1 Tax=Roseovarius pelagicus TaxID=2980108 RepID=A0ABY6DA31_9RHOB|nr:enoyl-CoA hydratase-related protein [Roseovarius pelagicus]UXX82997.1 enoyl-CoA hydratase-related protein [Roseovarius pelagicus]
MLNAAKVAKYDQSEEVKVSGQDLEISEDQDKHHPGVRVITLAGGTGGALDPGVRTRLSEALVAAQADPDVRAMVLCGEGGIFSAGVNVTEYGAPLSAPWVDVLAEKIEASAKPVVAAIAGVALGAGFALALAAHGRVAHAEARVGLPEVKLGLVPAGGATQRLPRFVGAQVSLALMLSGRPVSVRDPGLKRVFGRIETQGVVAAASEMAIKLADAGPPVRSGDLRIGLTDPGAYLRSTAEIAAKGFAEDSAEAGIVRAVEAALLLPFEQGMALEVALFEEARMAPAARAARHMLMAERRAATVALSPPGTARQLRDVIVTGRRGAFVETTIMALDVGWAVHLRPPRPADAPTIRDRVTEIYDGAVGRGRMDAAARDARLGRLHLPDENVSDPDMPLVFELGGAGPTLAGDPIRVRLGEADMLHPEADGPQYWARLYAPAHSAPLAEVAFGSDAQPDAIATVVQALRKARKTVIRAGIFPGMIGHNLDWALWSAALALAEAGHSPYDIDIAAEKLGYAIGPFRQMDVEGLAVAAARLDHLAAARGAPPLSEHSPVRHLARDGHSGRRAGRGFYIYEAGTAQRDSALLSRIQGLGATPDADLGAVDPGAALEAAIVNEAARLLARGVALRASDIDVVLVKGSGIDRRRGGLLIQADIKGLFPILQVMKSLQDAAPHVWQPQDGVLDMVKNGVGFFGRV